MSDKRRIMLLDIRLIQPSNTKLNEEVVAGIVREGWKPEKSPAIPVWYDGKVFIPTDGNHRVEALKRLGMAFAPVVELTRSEFDHVKYSKRHVDIMAYLPHPPLVVTVGRYE